MTKIIIIRQNQLRLNNRNWSILTSSSVIRQIMKRRRDKSDCTTAALRKKFKEVSEEISPPPGLEYNILQRLERENVKKSSSFFTGIRFIIEPN